MPQSYHPQPAQVVSSPSAPNSECTPLLNRNGRPVEPATSAPIIPTNENWERRPSFLGFGGGNIKQSREHDKLVNYIQKTARLNTVRELRPQRLIGEVSGLFDWSKSYKDEKELKTMKNRKLKAFYEHQNDLISKYEEVDKLLDSGIQHTMIRNYGERNQDSSGSGETADIDEPAEGYEYNPAKDAVRPMNSNLHRKDSAVPGDVDLETGNVLGYNKSKEVSVVKFAIMVNYFVNVILLIGKVIVAILTSSISIVASLIDSALDFLSTSIIYFSNKLAQSKHSDRFPVGKNRLEPLGVLVFSIIIIISFSQVALEALDKLLHNDQSDIVKIGLDSILIMVFTIVTKLACYFWCKSIESSSVEALTQDALLDVVFNSFSILMPLLGYYFQLYWFDPLGALLLSGYIVTAWTLTGIEHIVNLTGRNADDDDLRVVLYLCSRFAERIDKIKDISCYHVGDGINVEVDLILDSNLSVRDSHDIAEALQYTLEALPIVDVERAFVHIDYTVGNYKGHLN